MVDIDFEALQRSLVRREAPATDGPPTNVPVDHAVTMAAAADEVEACMLELKQAGSNLVAEVLRDQGEFVQLKHYPAGDIYDPETCSQYFYHAHREGEHGHFHVFLRPGRMSGDIAPASMPDSVARPLGREALGHIIAISMDRRGEPIRLFTANRWLTGETWYGAAEVAAMIDLFRIGHARPSGLTNRWVGAMLRLFRPQIEWLLRERDAAVDVWQAGHPDSVVYEDRGLDITSMLNISVDDQIQRVRAAAGSAPCVPGRRHPRTAGDETARQLPDAIGSEYAPDQPTIPPDAR